MHKRNFLIIFIILLLSTNLIHSKDLIFYEFDFPPFLITDDNTFSEFGILNYFKAEFTKTFSNYNIEIIHSNNLKIWSELNKKPNVIIGAGLMTPDRAEIALYSHPYLLLLPNGIIIEESSYKHIKPYLNEVGEIKLEHLITDSNLKGGINLEQSYGEYIDMIIGKHKNSKFLFPDYFDSFEDKLYTLTSFELDYVIGYPVEASFFMKKNPQFEGKIVNIPIEGVTEFSLLHMVVSKSETGEKLLPEINSFIDRTISKKDFHEKYEYWLDEESIKRYKRYISEVFNIKY